MLRLGNLAVNRSLRRAACLAVTALLLPAAGSASDLPPRKAGLWIVTSKDNPFANWSACVDDSKDDVINTDIWTDFAAECEVLHTEKTEKGRTLLAQCQSGLTGKVKLLVELSGDFQSQYHLESTTVFAGKDGEEAQSFTIDARHGGECPTGMLPGQKKMAR